MMRCFVIFLITVGCLLPADAWSCSCAGRPTDNVERALSAAESSDLVILARVDERVLREWWNGQQRMSGSTVYVSVIEILKGDSGTTTMSLSPGPGTCAMNFRAGWVYFIFANRSELIQEDYMTSMCAAVLYAYEAGRADRENKKLHAKYAEVIDALRQAYAD